MKTPAILLAGLILPCFIVTVTAQSFAEISETHEDVTLCTASQKTPVYERPDQDSRIIKEFFPKENFYVYGLSESSFFYRAADIESGFIGYVLRTEVDFVPKELQRFFILEQSSSPIEILELKSQYVGSRLVENGIHHEVRYRNRTNQDIVAVGIMLVSFNVWNELLDRTEGISMQPLAHQAEVMSHWTIKRLFDFSFFSSVAYVGHARFANGTVWVASQEEVLGQLRALEMGLDEAILNKPTMSIQK